ncbi:unnamed protein product [Caenorhabditis brenneri]
MGAQNSAERRNEWKSNTIKEELEEYEQILKEMRRRFELTRNEEGIRIGTFQKIFNNTEESRNYYNNREKGLLHGFMMMEEKLRKIKELYENTEKEKDATIERLMAQMNDLIIKNIELKSKAVENNEPEEVINVPKPSGNFDNRLIHQIINRYSAWNIEMLVSKLEVFFKEIIANGRNLYKIHRGEEKSGYTMLNYMRVEGNIKSMKIHLANKLIGIKHEYPEKKQELTIKMRKRDPEAIEWHKKNLQSNLRDLKWKMEYIKATLDTHFSQEILESFLISLAYLFFSFQYNNQQLLLSGNSSFPLERYFPEVYNLDIIDWIFQHFVGLERSGFSDRIDFYKLSAEEYLSKFDRLELSDPLATD